MTYVKTPAATETYLINPNIKKPIFALTMPAFVGYTEFAKDNMDDLTYKPKKISSMNEYVKYFGKAPDLMFDMDVIKLQADKELDTPSPIIFQLGIDVAEDGNTENKSKYIFCVTGNTCHNLYYNVDMFFQTGGKNCYIVSAGNYRDKIDKKALIQGIAELKKVDKVNLIAIPEAIGLSNSNDFSQVQKSMLAHCGNDMKNRFALLDIYPDTEDGSGTDKMIETFWDGVGTEFLSYGAAFFPYINTNRLKTSDISNATITYNIGFLTYYNKFAEHDPAFAKTVQSLLDWNNQDSDYNAFHTALLNASPMYQQAIQTVISKSNALPPSCMIAGLLSLVDSSHCSYREINKISMCLYTSLLPTVNLDYSQISALGNPENGKAINIMYKGCGEMALSGARTLDCKSEYYSLISMRQLMIQIETSLKDFAKQFIHETNTACTWEYIKTSIEFFLGHLWKDCLLKGRWPEEAFQVQVGLGDTMVADDIFNGFMRIKVMVAPTAPSKFLEIPITLEMGKS